MSGKFKDKPFTNTPKLSPQHRQILDHLKCQGSISQLEATALHRIDCLAKRISELRLIHGYEFTKEWKTDVTGKRYMRYSINQEEALDDEKRIAS
ncbi:helix-turn-helix domain-containing protein [Marinicella marina]|uniref:helix-turn-helix domain-containing protein n=1 Tax=Marinicella marina TaxID=2996016 RepID=UPI003D2F5472